MPCSHDVKHLRPMCVIRSRFVASHLKPEVAMFSAHAFQQILAIVKEWWLSGLKVNGRYAFLDCPQCQLIRYRAAYTTIHENQQRGALHLHYLVLQLPRPTRVPYLEISRVTTNDIIEVD